MKFSKLEKTLVSFRCRSLDSIRHVLQVYPCGWLIAKMLPDTSTPETSVLRCSMTGVRPDVKDQVHVYLSIENGMYCTSMTIKAYLIGLLNYRYQLYEWSAWRCAQMILQSFYLPLFPEHRPLNIRDLSLK